MSSFGVMAPELGFPRWDTVRCHHSQFTTTDDTTTTMPFNAGRQPNATDQYCIVRLLENESAMIQGMVKAVASDGSVGSIWRFLTGVRRPGSSPLAEIGTPEITQINDAGAVNWRVLFSINAGLVTNLLNLRIKGDPLLTVNWNAQLWILEDE